MGEDFHTAPGLMAASQTDHILPKSKILPQCTRYSKIYYESQTNPLNS